MVTRHRRTGLVVSKPRNSQGDKPGTATIRPFAPAQGATTFISYYSEGVHAPVHLDYLVNGRLLLFAYSALFDRAFVPYAGPDEAPDFEPEDYPIH